jgi:methionyl-tRNA formyltransferase
MNIVFMGSGQFGIPSLRMLAGTGHRVLCVVTQPDKKQNRGMRLEPTAVKKAALELGLELFQPGDINSAASIAHLRRLGADLFVIIAYGQKLSQTILDIPAIMPVNIHASLLPAYRGAAPVNWALINGEKQTGVTLMKVTLRMDTGPVLLQKSVDILDSDTAPALADKLSACAPGILIAGIDRLASGACPLAVQDESKASYAAKLRKSDGLIDWNKPAAAIANLVRGCMPWPGAFTHYKGKLVKIHKVSALSETALDGGKTGQVIGISREGITVAAGRNAVLMESVQMEGKRVISAYEFAAGYKVKIADTFG